jgi:hypothetical protein
VLKNIEHLFFGLEPRRVTKAQKNRRSAAVGGCGSEPAGEASIVVAGRMNARTPRHRQKSGAGVGSA